MSAGVLFVMSIRLTLNGFLPCAVERDAQYYGPTYDALVQMMVTLLMETFATYQQIAKCAAPSPSGLLEPFRWTICLLSCPISQFSQAGFGHIDLFDAASPEPQPPDAQPLP